MKKKTLMLTIMLALFSLSKSFAQDCKVTTDPITNEKVSSYSSKFTYVFKPYPYYLKGGIFFENKKGDIALKMQLSYSGQVKTIIPAGAEFVFKLENGEIIKLLTASDAVPTTQVVIDAVASEFTFVMQVNKEILSKIAASKVVLVRYPDEKGTGTYDLDNGKMGKALSKGAQCMLNNL